MMKDRIVKDYIMIDSYLAELLHEGSYYDEGLYYDKGLYREGSNREG